MEFIRIAIYTKDEDYGEMLSKRLTQFYPRFFVTLLSESMLSDTNFREQYDLVLIDGLKEPLKGKYIGLVTSLNDVRIKEDSLEYKLYKYGNIREIVRHLLFIYGKLSGNKIAYSYNQNGQVIAFISSRGGSGVTSIAKSTANALSRFKDKKVLYFSLEEVLFDTPNTNIKRLDEFLYHYREERPNATYLECYMLVNIWNTWKFNTSLGKNSIKELDSNELEELINFIKDYGDFDYICIDCSQHFSKREETLFQNADKLVVVYDLNRGQEDINFLMDYFQNLIGHEGQDKIIHIANNFNYGLMVDKIDDAKYSYILDHDPDSFIKERQGEASLDLAFGKGIKLLAANLT